MQLPLFAVAIGPIDAAIVVVYVLASTLLGIWLGRGQADQRDYFLGGKRLPTWALLLSIVSTETSTVTFLSVPGLAFVEGGNFRFLQIAFGYILGRLAIVALLLPHYFRGEMLTAYQVLEQRFGLATRRLASLVFLVTRSIADGLRLFLTALALHVAVGIPVVWSIVLLSIAIGLYSCFGGVRSIVWNDCLQFTVYMVGAVVAAVLLVWRIPGGWDQLMEFAESTGRLQLFDFDTSLTKSGVTFWSGLIGGAFLSLASHGTDQMIVQRYLCARDRGAASWALASSGFVVFLQFALFLFIGLELACYYTLSGRAATMTGDEAFMTFIAHDLETGLSGLLLAGAFAAAISSSLNSLASSVMSDWMGPQLAVWGERKSLAVARWLTIFFAVVQCVVAIGVDQLAINQSVVDSVLKIAGFATGLILGLYGLGLLAPRTSQVVAIAAFFTGVVVMFSVAFGTDLNGYWYALVGSGSIVLSGLLYHAVANMLRPRDVAFLVAMLLVPASSLLADFNPQVENHIDAAVEEYLKRGEMAGCVVVIGRETGVLFKKAYGDRQIEPEEVPMTLDTLFDMASLTKPIATGTSVMLLVERGELRLSDRVSQFFPEFAAHDKGEVTIEQLLVHSAGLIPDNSLDDYDEGWASALPKICDLKPLSPPGKKFKYSDVGFILLGKIVEQVSGKPVNEFAKEEVFAKIGMKDSGYLPSDELKQRAATTEKRDGKWLRGVVHDPRAAQMGGVAGHAGLFSTAHDLVRYAQMMLRGGELDGVRVLSEATVSEMTRPRKIAGNKRGLGWDMGSEYSRNRGETMSPRAFGHGGFTGTAMWIDPKLDLFVIFLSTRLHPDGVGEVNSLAGRIGAIAAGAVSGEMGAGSDATRHLGEQSVDEVSLGIDVLEAEGFEPLRGKRVGLITNHTGVNRKGVSTARLLHDANDVKLVALFSPEHGFAGALDVNHIGDSRHEELDVPIYSLYGKSRKPAAAQLKEIDVLVYDIQDVGARFYTYIATLGMGLEAAADAGIEFMVLDRPNPIDGEQIEGPIRDKNDESFVAYHTLPLRHGMTVGELARMYAAERKHAVKLTVIPIKGWRRNQSWHDTGLEWINPSPNMRSETAALLYPGIGLLETTNVSVGRGTDAPFEVLGAPWIDERELASRVNRAQPPGVCVVPIRFRPTASKFAGEECGGLNFVITDWDAFRPFELGMIVAHELRKLHPKDWDAKPFNRLLVNEEVFRDVLSGTSVKSILDSVEPQVQQFRARREPYLLYR